MWSKQVLALVILPLFFANAVCVDGQAQTSRPDLSGKWTLVEGPPGGNSPLGNEGIISQDTASVTFQAMRVPFDGSTTTKDSGAFIWHYEGQWIGFAFVVSMKASTGRTPANFTDLMIVSPTSADALTMMLINTTMGTGQITQTYTLKYKRS